MQINTEHLRFLEKARIKFNENPKFTTYQSEDGELIALCHRYDDDTAPSIEILELGPRVAFFANILNTEIKVGESNG